MKPHPLICIDGQRRQDALRAGANGIESVHLTGRRIDTAKIDEKFLRLVLLRPERELTKDQFEITGGVRIRKLPVTSVARPDDVATGEPSQVWHLTLKCDGDEADYVLRIHAPGDPSERAKDFDPELSRATFAYQCAIDFQEDCVRAPCPPPREERTPPINYLAKDYASFRQLIFDRLSQTMPEWRERHAADLGVTLIEVMAYVADHLSYYQDAVATEAYLGTARLRISVRRHARLVDYYMHEGCNARAWLFVEVKDTIDVAGLTFFTAPSDPSRKRGRKGIGNKAALLEYDETDRIVFEPIATSVKKDQWKLYKSHNDISLYTWGERECCLPKGATYADLANLWTDKQGDPPPQIGDLLLLEEMIGPQTGVGADADPSHRHVVRITKVEWLTDLRPQSAAPPAQPPMYHQQQKPPPVEVVYKEFSVLRVSWDQADALPFAACVSTGGRDHITVARGNIVLVDHGLTRSEVGETLVWNHSRPLLIPAGSPCEAGHPLLGVHAPLARPRRFYSAHFKTPLRRPLTYAAPFPDRVIQARTQSRWLARETEGTDDQIRQTRGGLATWGAQTIGGSSKSVDLENVIGPAYFDVRPQPQGSLPCLTVTDKAKRLWTSVRDLLASGPDDRHFVVEIDDRGELWLRFGDGRHGRNPPADEVFRIDYRVGSGARGNVGAETILGVVSDTGAAASICRVRNPLPASGGTDPESLDNVRRLAPVAFRTELARAVTAADYATLAQRDDRVQRAAATMAWTGTGYDVRIAVDLFTWATDKADDPAAEEALIHEEIAAYLNRFRRMGHDLTVVAPRQALLSLTLTITVEPHTDAGAVETAVRDELSAHALPDGRLGFFHPDGLTFGQPIEVSVIIARVSKVPGVVVVKVETLQRKVRARRNVVADGVLSIGPLEIARLDPRDLHLTMEGGR